MRQQRDAIEQLLGDMFSVWSVLRCYKQDNSRVWLVVRQSLVSKGVNMEAEEAMALEGVTRRQPGRYSKLRKLTANYSV
jgi:hypothetical protein